jgi:signal transduction histidine kinase
LNTAEFVSLTGIPIQVVRAGLAVLITVCLIRASQIAEDERQRRFTAAQQARLDALQQVQRELEEREALRRDLLRHTVTAQEEERARIARELHDDTAQILTALRLNLATLQDALRKNPEAIGLIERMERLSRQMSLGLYRIMHDLRPAQLDDLGLVAALRWLVDEERSRSALEVDLVVRGPHQRLDAPVETALFRIAQEALANVARHSGCSQALLQLSSSPQEVTLIVADQGAGFDPDERHSPPRGWGLVGMRERAESVGGQLKICSAPGKGTQVEALILLQLPKPTEREEAAHEHHPFDVGR